MRVVGCDPGIHGAVCLYDQHRGPLAIYDVPNIPKPVKGKGKLTIDSAGLGAIFRTMDATTTLLVVEKVGGMPGQGITSTFNFGKSAGFFTGVGHYAFRGYHEVVPAVWKRFHGLIGGTKTDSRAKASRLFPAFADQFARVKDDGRAESCLIAAWGAEMFLTSPKVAA